MAATINAFESKRAAPRGGHYSHATALGDLIFLSGQLPAEVDGSHHPEKSFEEQARRALENLLAILADAGSGPDHVLKVTAYIVGGHNWPAFNAIYAEMFGDARPARTVVPVPELHHGYLVEIDAVAVKRQTQVD